jgi:signal transduction histidine kinase
MKPSASEEEIQGVIDRIESAGARAHPSRGDELTVIGAIGDLEREVHVAELGLEMAPGVDRVVPILKPYKLASAEIKHGQRTIVEIDGRKLGGDHFGMIAGPCTVESREQVLTTARIVRDEPLGPIVGIAIGLRSGRGRARLDRERSDLVATVAHELRSPLTGVKGFVQALLNRWDKLSDAQRRLMLETVNSDADRLARLIAELLDVARIDTGRLQLYPRPASAQLLVSRVVDSIEAGTSREIVLDVADDLPDVFADPDKLTQVVTNLVENAVRHGAGRVTVALREHDDGEGPVVRVTVDDEGEGIPAELHRRVFTKFWTTGESGGSGLGMYIVGGLTRAHGGRVTIDRAPGGGARVCVDWPTEDRRPD